LASAAICAAIAVFAVVPRAEAETCIDHIRAVETEYELPAGLLEAISYLESRNNPLAINRSGESFRPGSLREAESLLIDAAGRPYQNVAIGCMQIFARYHLDEVDGDPTQFLDPAVNVDYAARLLLFLRDHTGTWRDAVGRYHTGPSSPNYERYICAVDRQLADMGADFSLDCAGG
jgi:soluble lytic murein transglycosylase-like protein